MVSGGASPGAHQEWVVPVVVPGPKRLFGFSSLVFKVFFSPKKKNLGVGGEDSPTQPNPHWFVLPCCGFKPGGAVPLVLEKKTLDSCSSASPPAPKEARYVPAVV